MSCLTKSLKEKIERLIDLEPYNTIRINLILNKGQSENELNLIVANEITTLNDKRTEILIKKRIDHERLKKNLDEFELNVLEIKLNAEMKILENKEN